MPRVPLPRTCMLAVAGLVALAAVVLARPLASPPDPPSGTIAFARSSGRAIDLHLVDLATGATRRSTRGPGTSTAPAWSPDGQVLAFARRIDIPYSIWLLDVSTARTERITSGAAIDGRPTWSPDGKRLAFASNRSDGATMRIHVVDLDEREPRALTVGGTPNWGPEGAAIAFIDEGDLWTIEADGTGRERLTSGPEEDATPAWSPDGSTIAFSRRIDGRGVLALIDLTTRRVTLIDSGGDDSMPTWSPDGRWVAVSRAGASSASIVAIDVTSGAEHVVTRSTLYDLVPSWRPVND